MFALLLASVSWFAIHETISFETVISDIPIRVKVGEGWTVLHQSDDTVSVTVRGAQEDIRLIDAKQLKATVEVRGDPDEGPLHATVVPSDIQGIRAARIVHVKPEEIQVTLDREDEKLIPVNTRAVGKPFHGEVEKIICEPTIVLIRGPARQLARTDWVYTEPVDVQNRVQSFTKRVQVLPPSAMQPYRIEPPDVLVHVVIAEKAESTEWKDVPVLAVLRPGTTARAEITPDRVRVKVTGRAETLEQIGDLVPRAFVDCTDLDASITYDLPVYIHVEGREVSAAADPAFVRVVVRKP